MKKKSLVERVENFLRLKADWIHGGELERLAMDNGYKASNISRRCRELVEDGVLERKENEKGHVMYRYKQPVPSNIMSQQMTLV